MINWLKGRISSAVRRLEDLANGVIDGFNAVWNVFATLMHILRIVFGDLSNNAIQFLKTLLNFGEWVAVTLKNIVVKTIPNAVDYVIRVLQHWTTIAIAVARNALQYAINTLQSWVSRAISTVTDLITKVRDWLWGYVKPVVNWLINTGNRVADIVLHPDKLAAWVVPALWGPLWRYVQAQAVPIGRWVLARSVGAVLGSAGLIESVIVKIF